MNKEINFVLWKQISATYLSKKEFDKLTSKEQEEYQEEYFTRLKERLIQSIIRKEKIIPTDYDIKQKRVNALEKLNTKELESVFLGVDLRFYNSNLIHEIHKEIDKTHKLDHKEKIALFIIRTSAELRNPSDRCSAALKGDSSSGKDNIIKTILNCFPEEDSFLLTRGTQSVLEEEAERVKCIAFSEINKHRENGANSDLTEIFKQLAEGGSNVIKRDQRTHQVIRLKSEQKCLLYGTTETESDEELETRYVIVSIKGNAEKNRIVVNDVLQKLRSKEHHLNSYLTSNWIQESISNLNHNVEIILPYTELFEKKILDESNNEKYLFDYSKERIKRDAKRLFSLTKAITWLFQKQRVQEFYDEITFINSEPEDFLLAIEIFSEFMNTTYEGFDHRYKLIIDTVKELSDKCDNEILQKKYPSTYNGWAIQEKVWKKTGLNKETFKKRLKWLKDEGYVESFYDKSIHGQTSLLQVGVQVGKEPVISISIPTCTHLLNEWNTPNKRKEIYKSTPKIKNNLFNLEDFRDKNSKIPTSEITTYKNKEISSDEIIKFIEMNNGQCIEALIEKFSSNIQTVLSQLAKAGIIFEPREGFWKIVE